ncbi:MAG: hypothetical protein ICV73_26665 [Acetobacteraceae bacterium]|nr:hypothetical protein [Acetobacteraceae bacterium]
MPDPLPHGQRCALRRAERVAYAVDRLERRLDRRPSLDLARLLLRRSRRRFRKPVVVAARIVAAKLAEAAR